MSKLSQGVIKISLFFDNVAKVITAIMMFLVAYHVIFRNFGLPVPGIFELVQLLNALIAGLAVAYCGVGGGHVSTSFLVEKLPLKAQKAWSVGVNLLVMAFMVFIFWHLGSYANNVRVTNQVTQTLSLPFYPIVYIISLGYLSYGIVALGNIVSILTNAETPDSLSQVDCMTMGE